MNSLLIKRLQKIGHTTFEMKGFLCFICDPQTYNIESLLLEMMLEGMEFKILSEIDYDDGDILIKTDIPSSIFF